MIQELLKNKTAKEKAKIKSRELAKVKFSRAFTQEGIKIKIVGDIEAIEVNGSHGIQLFAQAWKDGKQLGFGKDGSIDIERFRIFNPPVLVDSPTGDIIREWTEEDGTVKQRKLKYDPMQAIKQDLAHTIKLVGKENSKIIKGSVGNTTSTFYPDANSESTSVDGDVRRNSAGESWTNIRTGAGTGSDDSSTTMISNISTNSTSNEFSGMYRSVTLFDTSALPDADTIDSASLSLYGQGKIDQLSLSWSIYTVNPASNTALVNADYSTIGFTSQSDTDISTASFSTAGYNDWTLNATGLASIIKTGVSKFSILSTAEGTDTAPTWVSSQDGRIISYTADQTGTANDPKLVVVHAAAVTFVPKVMMF